MYELILSEQAQADYDWLAQTHGEAFIERVDRLLLQLKNSPRRGIGRPKPLGWDLGGLLVGSHRS